ncbi:AraC family transcriptional regulator [Christensenellaceae bacterium OttesenSCG-928-K19]|nr:AraC family transcriptional regulator [Christensenellaceae bacterium OttesenSCG-928-K19]
MMYGISGRNHFAEETDEQIVSETYKRLTGVACGFFSSAREAVCPLGAGCSMDSKPVSENFGRMLRVLDTQSKPYVYYCKSGLVFWAVEAWSQRSGSVLFIAGPAQLEDTPPQSGCLKEKGKIAAAVPVVTANSLLRVSQLLYDMVKLRYAPREEEPAPMEWQDAEYDRSALSIGSKTEILKTSNKLKKKIYEILELVQNKKYCPAREAFKRYAMSLFHMYEPRYAKSIMLKVAYLFSHIVAESSHFIYTRKMLALCGDYAEQLFAAGQEEEIYAAVCGFARAFVQELRTSAVGQSEKTISEKVIHHITYNYSSGLSLQAIAGAINFNTCYIARAFKLEMGMTIKQYLTIYRVERAFELILSSGKTMAEIAREVGFSNPKLFRQHFKAHYGVCPSSLRSSRYAYPQASL